MSASKYTPATVDDFIAMYGYAPPFSFRGVTLSVDDVVRGIGGVYIAGGKKVAFSRVMAPVRKRFLVGLVHKVERLFEGSQVVYAVRDKNIPTSGTLLTHLGFVPIEGSEENYVLWRKHFHS